MINANPLFGGIRTSQTHSCAVVCNANIVWYVMPILAFLPKKKKGDIVLRKKICLLMNCQSLNPQSWEFQKQGMLWYPPQG